MSRHRHGSHRLIAAAGLVGVFAAGCAATRESVPPVVGGGLSGRSSLDITRRRDRDGDDTGKIRLVSGDDADEFESGAADVPDVDRDGVPAPPPSPRGRNALSARRASDERSASMFSARPFAQSYGADMRSSATTTSSTHAAPASTPSTLRSLSDDVAGRVSVGRFTSREPIPIDLETALEATSGRNPEVAFARARIREANAQQLRATTLWLPSLRGGVNYNIHQGRIQDVRGVLFDTDRNALYRGFGANAVGAGSPAIPGVSVNFHLADALFQPHAAEHAADARRLASRAVRNDMLLQTALAYNELLRAEQELAIADDTLERVEGLGKLTGEFARTGEGLQSDHERVLTETALRRNERQRADEAIVVASARLAQLLRLDPTRRLMPQEPAIVPIELGPPGRPPADLVAQGLRRRPELAENRQLVCEAVARLQREKFAPLVPSVLVGVSYGRFEGGLGNDLVNDGDRIDTDAVAWWEVRNLGFGEHAARKEAQARVDQARQRALATMDRVAREIVEAAAQVESRRAQTEVARDGVATALRSYEKNVDRIRNGQGLPIEALQAIQALNAARRDYLRAVAEFNAAQFQLHRALGCPI